VRKFTRATVLCALMVGLGLTQAGPAQSAVIDLPGGVVVDANAQLPGIQVGDLNVLNPSEANVLATIDTQGLATNVFVEYGPNGILSYRTPVIQLAAGLDLADVVVKLLNLDPNSIINYRIVAENSAGTSSTTTGSFTTSNNSSTTTPGKNTTTVVVVDLASGRTVSGAAALGKRTARCTIVGNSKSNTLRGTRKRDVICGLGGNDRIRGLGGNDVIIGGPGRDSLNGNSGRDRLYGNGGNDKLVSRDRKIGEPLNGGSGRDKATVDRGDRMKSIEKSVRMAVKH
jgi:Ca2+-binding RTX toxin-like protein